MVADPLTDRPTDAMSAMQTYAVCRAAAGHKGKGSEREGEGKEGGRGREGWALARFGTEDSATAPKRKGDNLLSRKRAVTVANSRHDAQ